MENNDKKNESGLEWEFKGRPNPREIEAEDVTPDLGKTVIDTKADGQIKELKTLTEQKPEQKSEQKPEQKPERSPELIVEINKIVADRFKNSDSEAIQYHQRLSGYWSLLMLAFIAALLAVVVTRYVHYTSVAQSEVESAALEESAKSLARTISERKLTSELLGYGSYLKTIDRKDLAERYPELVPPPKSSNTTDSALLDLDSLINRYTISDTICDASRMRGTQIESEIVGLSPKVAEELKKIGNNTSTSMSQLVEILGCSGIAPENGVATYASVASAGAYMGNNTIGFTLTDEYPDCAAAVRRMVPDGPMADSIIKITTSYGQSEKQKTKFPDGGTEEKTKGMVECAIDDAKLTKLTRPEKGVTLAQVYRVMGRLDELSRVGADVLSRSQSDLQKLEENLKRTREKIEEQKSILRKYDAGFAYTILLQLLMSAACLLGINAGYQSSRAHAYEAVSIRRKRRLVDMMILLRSTEQKISPRIARQAMIEARDNPFSPKGNQDGLEMANTRTLTRTLGKLMGIAKMMRPDAQLPASPIDTTSSRKSATDEKPAKPAKP